MAESSAREEVDKESLIQQYVNITGSDKESAEHLLEAFSWNVESAVNMYLEGGSNVNNDKDEEEISEILAASSSSSSHHHHHSRSSKKRQSVDKSDDDPILIDDISQCSSSKDPTANAVEIESVDVDDYVRAPIPQQQAVLVEDQYHALPYPQRRRQPASRNVFDGFRDFKKETEEQEKLLKTGANSMSEAAQRKKRLHELFRPPVDILHPGDFQSARTQCTSKNRWLLVNVQNTMEFASQVLNRDVWSNNIVREILNENFILWQVYHDSNEGQHYGTFYKIHNYPHLAVIDPRTGERMVVWENLGMRPSANQFAELATLFLSENPSLNGEMNNDEEEVDMKVTTDVDSSKIIDRSEDAQLEAAIQASLEMKTIPRVISVHDDGSDEEIEENDDDEDQSVVIEDDEDGDDDDDIVVSDQSESCMSRKRRKMNSFSSENPVPVEEEKPKNQETKDSTVKIQTSTNVANNPTDGTSITTERTNVRKDGEQAKILLRTPTNERKQIVISLECTLEDLAKEVSELGWTSSRYELVRSFPRQNLSSLNQQLTLKESGLHKQETLFIQDR